jgi:hypothetical protein
MTQDRAGQKSFFNTDLNTDTMELIFLNENIGKK